MVDTQCIQMVKLARHRGTVRRDIRTDYCRQPVISSATTRTKVMGQTAKTIEDHKNIMQSVSGTIASMGLTKIGRPIAGVIVTPAVWVLNYSTQGATPDKVDAGLFGFGFISAPASITVGLVKAVVDDDMGKKLREIQAGEDSAYSRFIKPCYSYASSAPQINATTIASRGGTAWKHQNGLWVYITDAKGRLVNDFKPRKAVVIYQPKIPMIKGINGRILWEAK